MDEGRNMILLFPSLVHLKTDQDKANFKPRCVFSEHPQKRRVIVMDVMLIVSAVDATCFMVSVLWISPTGCPSGLG